jgi:hypothetical protein
MTIRSNKMKMTIGAAMAMALMLSLPLATRAQEVPPAPNDAADVSAGAVDTAAQEANNASNAAIDAAGNASDAAGDAIEDSAASANEEIDRVGDRADEAQDASDNLADRADDANLDDQAPELDANAQLDADAQLRADAAAESQTPPAQLSDEDRNADWRFVERDGVWWYRTPMNTWMIHQDGDWQAHRHAVGYRGAQSAVHYNQHGQVIHHGQQQAYYNDGYQGQHVQQTAHQEGADHGWGEEHPSVGQQEWMCIDGRRTLVTVVSVSPASMDQGGQYYPERAASHEDGQQSMPAAPQGDWQDNNQGQSDQQLNDRRTPPPVPQPNDDADKQSSDHPEAPSKDRLQASSSDSNKSYSAAKPVIEGQPADAAALSDAPQAPAEPQQSYQPGQSSQAGPADGSFEGDADRNGGRIEATDIRD